MSAASSWRWAAATPHVAANGGAVRVLLLGLTLALYTHAAFAIYSGIFLLIEAAYFRDWRAVARLALASALAAVASLPTHWESLRYPEYVSFTNTVYDPNAPKDWAGVARAVYYNTEMLVFPQRWFNDYRSINNVWLPVLVVAALLPGRSRASYYAWLAVIAQALLRINTPEAGVIVERIQHVFPLLTAPALAGFVQRCAGTRWTAWGVLATLALYVSTAFAPIRHVAELRDWDPAFIDRVQAADGALIVIESNPHRDMDRHPTRRTPTTPFDVHFEGLLPGVTGKRFYAQMIDGWVWGAWRGEVVAAGTFRGTPLSETPAAEFDAEMARWGVKHLFVWTDAARTYLAGAGYTERWRGVAGRSSSGPAPTSGRSRRRPASASCAIRTGSAPTSCCATCAPASLSWSARASIRPGARSPTGGKCRSGIAAASCPSTRRRPAATRCGSSIRGIVVCRFWRFSR